jgi:hypothetical protein
VVPVGDVDRACGRCVDHAVLDLGVDHAPQVVLHAVQRADISGLPSVVVQQVGDLVRLSL